MTIATVTPRRFILHNHNRCISHLSEKEQKSLAVLKTTHKEQIVCFAATIALVQAVPYLVSVVSPFTPVVLLSQVRIAHILPLSLRSHPCYHNNAAFPWAVSLQATRTTDSIRSSFQTITTRHSISVEITSLETPLKPKRS